MLPPWSYVSLQRALVDRLVIATVAQVPEDFRIRRVAEAMDRAVAKDESGAVEMGAGEAFIGVQAPRILQYRLIRRSPTVNVVEISDIPTLEITFQCSVGVAIRSAMYFSLTRIVLLVPSVI